MTGANAAVTGATAETCAAATCAAAVGGRTASRAGVLGTAGEAACPVPARATLPGIVSMSGPASARRRMAACAWRTWAAPGPDNSFGGCALAPPADIDTVTTSVIAALHVTVPKKRPGLAGAPESL